VKKVVSHTMLVKMQVSNKLLLTCILTASLFCLPVRRCNAALVQCDSQDSPCIIYTTRPQTVIHLSTNRADIQSPEPVVKAIATGFYP